MPRALVVTAGLAVVPNVDFFALRVGQKIEVARHSSSSHALLQHPAPVPCVIGVDRRVWLARAPACLPFVQRDDALPSGMRRIDAAIRRDMRDRLDSRGNLHLPPPGSVAWSEFRLRHALHFCRPSIAWWMRTAASHHVGDRAAVKVQRIPFSSLLAYSLH